jgi:hypothetical protein
MDNDATITSPLKEISEGKSNLEINLELLCDYDNNEELLDFLKNHSSKKYSLYNPNKEKKYKKHRKKIKSQVVLLEIDLSNYAALGVLITDILRFDRLAKLNAIDDL